jgi:predicted RNA methylase
MVPDVAIQYSGTKMFLSPLRDASYLTVKYGLEPETMSQFVNVINKYGVDLFFDVGANIGAYSWTARKYGVKNILLLEPDPVNCRLIRKSLAVNGIKNCFLVEAAAFSSTKLLPIYYY